MIVDANLLLYAVDESSPPHERAAAWLTEALNGDVRIGLPWQTLAAFLRIVTHPRVTTRPLASSQAHDVVTAWLAAPAAWVPAATATTYHVYEQLAARHHVTGNLVPDAMLAALAVEHGVVVASADSDFARFAECRWVNPLAH